MSIDDFLEYHGKHVYLELKDEEVEAGFLERESENYLVLRGGYTKPYDDATGQNYKSREMRTIKKNLIEKAYFWDGKRG